MIKVRADLIEIKSQQNKQTKPKETEKKPEDTEEKNRNRQTNFQLK